MIQVIKFKAAHLEELVKQEGLAYLRPYASSDHIAILEQSPHSYTGIHQDKIMICAGVADIWENRGEAWAVLDQSCKDHFFEVHNAVKRFLNLCPVRRIEATVDLFFEEGHRWVKALGFVCEAPIMKAYRQGGHDTALYAKVRGD